MFLFPLSQKPQMGASLYKKFIADATDTMHGIDVMQVILRIAGVLVETCFLYDEPDIALENALENLGERLKCKPFEGALPNNIIPPAHILDRETEKGRAQAKDFFEEWLECQFEFSALANVIIHSLVVAWEDDGLPRQEAYRLIIECAQKCMMFEMAAQELCDVVIANKALKEGWKLGNCVTALSAIAGERLSYALNSERQATISFYTSSAHAQEIDWESLNCVVHVMTQEAVRLGVPAGSDWRLGLAANDIPLNPPLDLVEGIEPYCRTFFDIVGITNMYEQTVACAKAAGRMLAVVSAGELPEMEPAIAKPLAMAAITETYTSLQMPKQAAYI